MKSGELRRWSSVKSSIVDSDRTFLVVSIDGGMATFMDDDKVYFFRASTIEDLSEPLEEPNDQG